MKKEIILYYVHGSNKTLDATEHIKAFLERGSKGKYFVNNFNKAETYVKRYNLKHMHKLYIHKITLNVENEICMQN
jgi:hypothetical protein